MVFDFFERKRAYVKLAENLEWVSILKAIGVIDMIAKRLINFNEKDSQLS